MLANFFRIANAIVLWMIIIRFLPKQSFKKYLPVTLFSSSILFIGSLYNLIFKWWTVKGGTKYILFDAIAFIIGPFFFANLWVFHFTNGRFSLYALTNFVMDLLFAYPLNTLFQRIGHYKLLKFHSRTLFLISYSLAFVNYAVQKFMERRKLFMQ
ncbi:hypothetical protein D8M04_11745 [Oceanobacillus piezotolerans]|uniref:Uncharacterized protein n=1 Tax=Oceanobacillus piezotolerans TaxID=2448030 RepID=A0A498D403_9BACI|nr:hypothetical protein [Oceanobacillus piezotolerans]RLL43595.1 hypothetical protein D8M04_11745 [Oceanobacillus piezotolerans]